MRAIKPIQRIAQSAGGTRDQRARSFGPVTSARDPLGGLKESADAFNGSEPRTPVRAVQSTPCVALPGCGSSLLLFVGLSHAPMSGAR